MHSLTFALTNVWTKAEDMAEDRPQKQYHKYCDKSKYVSRTSRRMTEVEDTARVDVDENHMWHGG